MGHPARRLHAEARSGELVAVDDNRATYGRLAAGASEGIHPVLSADNRVAPPNASADRVPAITVLHAIGGEPALREMRRLVAADGRVSVVDWSLGRDRAGGPADELIYPVGGADAALSRQRLPAERLRTDLPFVFALAGRRRGLVP